jgi:hypothetical protein
METPTFQSGEAYTPRFELWMNGIIWQAIYNVVNSFTMQEMMSIASSGEMKSGTRVPIDIFIERVRILEDTVLAVQRPDSIYESAMEQADKESDAAEQSHMIYQAILKLLHRNGHLRFKPPRDFADD